MTDEALIEKAKEIDAVHGQGNWIIETETRSDSVTQRTGIVLWRWEVTPKQPTYPDTLYGDRMRPVPVRVTHRGTTRTLEAALEACLHPPAV